MATDEERRQLAGDLRSWAHGKPPEVAALARTIAKNLLPSSTGDDPPAYRARLAALVAELQTGISE